MDAFRLVICAFLIPTALLSSLNCGSLTTLPENAANSYFMRREVCASKIVSFLKWCKHYKAS